VRIAFLLKDLQLSGGVHVVVRHATQLQACHGMEVTLVRTARQDEPDWPYPGLGTLRIADLDEVVGERFDIAIATWWETALDLFELDARRYVYFVQLLEDSHYPAGLPEALGFALTLALPVRFITEARWIAEHLERLQPGAPVLYVRNGIPKDQFPPPERIEPALGPLRVVVEGNPTLVRKGVPHALEAIRAMREPRHVTLVTGERGRPTPPGVDEHLEALSFDEMAAVFGRSHVLVKLSRAEGMYGPPLEAFHCGATVVTSPVTGHDEYVEHLVNGLVVDWDDPAGAARALDLLARDRRLLHRLRTNALATARTWPSWEQSSTLFAAALRQVAAAPPPDPTPAGRRLARDLGTVLNDLDARKLDRESAERQVAGLRSQRAVRAALAAREAGRPLLARAARLARRLGDGA
jgi:glycosyltransferase involved in cell wall biosynthesis